jgi:hypothetical protein
MRLELIAETVRYQQIKRGKSHPVKRIRLVLVDPSRGTRAIVSTAAARMLRDAGVRWGSSGDR